MELNNEEILKISPEASMPIILITFRSDFGHKVRLRYILHLVDSPITAAPQRPINGSKLDGGLNVASKGIF